MTALLATTVGRVGPRMKPIWSMHATVTAATVASTANCAKFCLAPIITVPRTYATHAGRYHVRIKWPTLPTARYSPMPASHVAVPLDTDLSNLVVRSVLAASTAAMVTVVTVGSAVIGRVPVIQNAHAAYRTTVSSASRSARLATSMAPAAALARAVTARTVGKDGSARSSTADVRTTELANLMWRTSAATVSLAMADITVKYTSVASWSVVQMVAPVCRMVTRIDAPVQMDSLAICATWSTSRLVLHGPR